MPAPTQDVATVTVVPLLGPFHLRMPAYNAVTVQRTVAAFEPDVVAMTAVPAGALDDPGWQDTPEVALPGAVVPWARRSGVALRAIGEPPEDPGAEADFRRYLLELADGATRLQPVDAALRPVRALLAEALSPERVRDELLPAVEAYQRAREDAFGDGPGTGWLRRRCRAMAERVATERGRVAVLAGVDEVPWLLEELGEAVRLEPVPRPGPDEASRTRGFLDYAMRADAPDPAAVLERLRAIDSAEARYLEANLLLTQGHAAEALEILETASRGDFSQPYYLPGFLLTRLGQLYDLDGRRDAAMRAYRGVRALSYAPPEAREAAAAGLERPFRWPSDGAGSEDAPGGVDRA